MGDASANRRLTLGLLLIAAVGLALRIAAARGGLWLDEAWSAMFAADSGTMLGVLFGINHDNNHHLNTLWLQLVGIGAPPLAMRALSIATGTVAIVVAGLIGTRRSRSAGWLTAALFAVSPMLVTFESEARGYAPMILCFLLAAWLLARWLDDPEQPAPSGGLALASFFGMFSQLGMAFGLVALLGWTFLALLPRLRLMGALRKTLRALGPALVVAALVLLVLWIAAHRSPTGFRFGNLDPFSLSSFLAALTQAMRFGLGLGGWGEAALLLGVAVLLLAARPRPHLRWLYVLAILGFPLGLMILHLPNAGYSRYHWLPVVALLLAIGDAGASALHRNGWRRWLAGLIFLVIFAASVITDVRDIRNLRGDPAAAVRAMAANAPSGTAVAISHARSEAVLRVAAAQARYPLSISAAPCPAPGFLYIDRDGDQPFPEPVAHCGVAYREIARGDPSGLSGNHWRLYRR